MLHPTPTDRMWLPYLGETLDSGIATLFAEETLEGVRFAEGAEPQKIRLHGYLAGAERVGGDTGTFVHGDQALLNGPIDDIQLRAWGIQLVDGRMPGFCAIVGCAKSNEVAVKIVRELQSRGILIFLSGNVNGRSIIHQLMEEGVQLGYDTFMVPFGIDTVSAIYALASRLALRSLSAAWRRARRARSCSTTRTAVSPGCWLSAKSTSSSTRPPPAPSRSASPSSPTPASRRSCRRA